MLAEEFSVNDELALKSKKIRPESDDPFYSEENISRLKKSAEQITRGQVVTKTLDELRKLVYG